MNRFRTYLLTHACYAADDGAGAPAAVVDTPAPDAPPPADAPPATDPPPAPPADDAPKPWVQTRISEITRQRHEAERRAAAAERERDELRARIQPDPNAPPDPAAERRYTQADLDREANARAQQIADRQVQQAAISRTFQAGETEYTPAAFTAACNALADAGANDKPEFLALVSDLPNGHDVLHRLGTDPAEAVRILALPPLRMAAEIGRISAAAKAAPAAPAPKQVSKAPPPVQPVGGGGGSVVETDPDKMTPAQYAAMRDKQRAARNGR